MSRERDAPNRRLQREFRARPEDLAAMETIRIELQEKIPTGFAHITVSDVIRHAVRFTATAITTKNELKRRAKSHD